MRKFIYFLIFAISVVLLSSCAQYTCPTYSSNYNVKASKQMDRAFATTKYCKPDIPYYIKKNKKR